MNAETPKAPEGAIESAEKATQTVEVAFSEEMRAELVKHIEGLAAELTGKVEEARANIEKQFNDLADHIDEVELEVGKLGERLAVLESNVENHPASIISGAPVSDSSLTARVTNLEQRLKHFL